MALPGWGPVYVLARYGAKLSPSVARRIINSVPYGLGYHPRARWSGDRKIWFA